LNLHTPSNLPDRAPAHSINLSFSRYIHPPLLQWPESAAVEAALLIIFILDFALILKALGPNQRGRLFSELSWHWVYLLLPIRITSDVFVSYCAGFTIFRFCRPFRPLVVTRRRYLPTMMINSVAALPRVLGILLLGLHAHAVLCLHLIPGLLRPHFRGDGGADKLFQYLRQRALLFATRCSSEHGRPTVSGTLHVRYLPFVMLGQYRAIETHRSQLYRPLLPFSQQKQFETDDTAKRSHASCEASFQPVKKTDKSVKQAFVVYTRRKKAKHPNV
jgi:hypothetical protein